MKRFADTLPLVLLGLMLAFFGWLEPRFLAANSLINLLTQSSSLIVAATGMTLVLLTAGVDLSLGAIMFVCAAVCGKLALAGVPLPLSVAALVVSGMVFGAVNASAIVALRLLPFVVTLAMLYFGRGLALEITQTRAMNLPEPFLALGRPWIAIPIMIAVVAAAHILLSRGVIGRHLYALGHSESTALESGLSPKKLLFFVYIASGLCASVAALLTLGQLGTVSPRFGENREFTAIAAAVLGGTSLFGGRGAVLPGTVIGSILMQSLESGLVMTNADPYCYPVVISAVIFFAVLIDAWKNSRGGVWRRVRSAS
ncbi:MAG: ABC transporter permease [Verrucomicrobiales bacterium]